jgi:DNA-binding transcriptional LysR family regulator
VVAGSPEYLRKHGVPQRPEDLRNHKIIASTSAFSVEDWRFGRRSKVSVKVHPRIRCNYNAAAVSMAASGWGLTRVLSYQVGPEVTAGQLRLVLEDYEEEPFDVHLVHGGTRSVSAKVRAFVDFAAKQLRANPIFAKPQ